MFIRCFYFVAVHGPARRQVARHVRLVLDQKGQLTAYAAARLLLPTPLALRLATRRLFFLPVLALLVTRLRLFLLLLGRPLPAIAVALLLFLRVLNLFFWVGAKKKKLRLCRFFFR